jgi:hypothetical protein
MKNENEQDTQRAFPQERMYELLNIRMWDLRIGYL